jgi:uncharacterized protein YfaS (alpha-2-macroglobulin family)
MTTIQRYYELGNTATIDVVLTDNDGDTVDPDQTEGGTYKMYIKITQGCDSSTKVDTTAMTRRSQGTFRYNWQTSKTDDQGEYKVEITATLNGKEVVNRDLVALVDEKN